MWEPNSPGTVHGSGEGLGTEWHALSRSVRMQLVFLQGEL